MNMNELEAAILNPGRTPVFNTRFELYDRALELRATRGSICEFGVHTGNSLKYLVSKAPRAQFHAFDSCQGLPGDWHRGENWVTPKGTYEYDMLKDTWPENVRLWPGWFEHTVPAFVDKLVSGSLSYGPSLIHIDSDLYESAKTVLTVLRPYLFPGVIIVFDELMDFRTPQKYTKWRDHEWRALAESGLKVSPIGRTTAEQVAVAVSSE